MMNLLSEAEVSPPEPRACPLRVMHVLPVSQRSGLETHVLNYCEVLRAAGGEAIVVPLDDTPFTRIARGRGYAVRPLEKRGHNDPLAIARLARWLREDRIDVLHSHDVFAAFYCAPAAWWSGTAHVCTVHTRTRNMLVDAYRSKLMRLAVRKIGFAMTRWAQRQAGVSESVREEMILEGASPAKTLVIYNAIDVEPYRAAAGQREEARAEFGLPPEATVVLLMARLMPVKNVPLGIRATARLLDEREDVYLLVAGDGPERPALERLTAELGIGHRVRFAGWRNDLPRLLAGADVAALTSKSEAAGVVLMEAMAAAKPAVVTAVEGTPEIIDDGVTGLLVPNGDVEAFAAAIRRLIRDKALAKRMGEAGRARAQRMFSFEAFSAKVLGVYHEIHQQRPRRRQ